MTQKYGYYYQKDRKLAESLRKEKAVCTAPHLIVEALAGTGKTTTLIEALRILKTGNTTLTPSPQQQAIWDAICLPKPEPQSVCFVAFNKPIAVELQQRVPDGCHAMTMHSMGLKAVRRAFQLKPGKEAVDDKRVEKIVGEILNENIWDLRKNHFDLLKATEKLVGLCKMNLFKDGPFVTQELWNEDLTHLAARYDVDLNSGAERVFDLVPKVLELCKDVDRDWCIDFNDMIWLPIVLNLNVYRYDLLLVDEAQDLNRCQQALAMKAGHRLILVGDSHQAIYGFAGADPESMKRMKELLRGTKCDYCNGGGLDKDALDFGESVDCPVCKGKGTKEQGCQTLPLTVTRRCSKAVVKEAQKLVPEFEAHESCCEGKVDYDSFEHRQCDDGDGHTDFIGYRIGVNDGDMILCRVNAPLVSECFKFLRTGRKANIQGRDVGAGLITTIKKLAKHYQQAEDRIGILWLLEKMGEWHHTEWCKENLKKNPRESRLIALQDRYDCLQAFCDGKTTVQEVIDSINAIFTDDKNGDGIKLSSIHKAKGLEAKTVFLLQPKGAKIPHPMAKSEWHIKEEYNLLFIAITRAIETLVYVS